MITLEPIELFPCGNDVEAALEEVTLQKTRELELVRLDIARSEELARALEEDLKKGSDRDSSTAGENDELIKDA